MIVVTIKDWDIEREYVELTLPDGQTIMVTYKKARGRRGQIGIEAPKNISIRRKSRVRNTNEAEQVKRQRKDGDYRGQLSTNPDDYGDGLS